MSDWIGLGFMLFILLGVLLMFLWLTRPYKLTKEEYEKRLKSGTGSLSTAVMGLQKILQPELEKAIEAQQDLRHARFGEQKKSGEGYDDEDENSSATAEEVKKPSPN